MAGQAGEELDGRVVGVGGEEQGVDVGEEGLEELSEGEDHRLLEGVDAGEQELALELLDDDVEIGEGRQGEQAEGVVLGLEHGHEVGRQEERVVEELPGVADGEPEELLAEVGEPVVELVLLDAGVLDEVGEERVVGAPEDAIEAALWMRTLTVRRRDTRRSGR